jgi:hypothetical protein
MKFPVICRGGIHRWSVLNASIYGNLACYLVVLIVKCVISLSQANYSLKIYASRLVNKFRLGIPLWKIGVWFVFKTGFVRINPGVQFPVKCARQHIIGITHSAQYEQLICTITYIILIHSMVFCIYSMYEVESKSSMLRLIKRKRLQLQSCLSLNFSQGSHCRSEQTCHSGHTTAEMLVLKPSWDSKRPASSDVTLRKRKKVRFLAGIVLTSFAPRGSRSNIKLISEYSPLDFKTGLYSWLLVALT